MCFEKKSALKLIIISDCTYRGKEKRDMKGEGRKISNLKSFNIFKSIERWKVITSASEAQGFTPANFIAGANWLRATTFPFSLGL